MHHVDFKFSFNLLQNEGGTIGFQLNIFINPIHATGFFLCLMKTSESSERLHKIDQWQEIS